MSINLTINPPTNAFTNISPCGVPISYLDSKILSTTTWAASWFSDLSLNTPLSSNPNEGRLNCGAMMTSRANFIGDTSSYITSPDGSPDIIESSGGGLSSWVAASSFPDQIGQYGPIPQGCISNSVYAFNNKYTNFQELSPLPGWTYNAKMASWGLYVEVRQHAKNSNSGVLTAGSTFGIEVDVISYGDAAGKLFPYGAPSYNNISDQKTIQIERAIGIGLSAGGGNLKAPSEEPQITDNTCAIAINGNGIIENGQYVGAKWKSGIVFTESAIRDPDYEAIILCDKYNINWYKSKNPNANDAESRNQLGASISGDSTGNANQMALSLTATNADGIPQEIAFNKYANNSLCPQYPNISLGSATNKWNELWAGKYILPSTKDGGSYDPVTGKPDYKGYTGEIRLSSGTGRDRLWICVDAVDNANPGKSVWGRINITV